MSVLELQQQLVSFVAGSQVLLHSLPVSSALLQPLPSCLQRAALLVRDDVGNDVEMTYVGVEVVLQVWVRQAIQHRLGFGLCPTPKDYEHTFVDAAWANKKSVQTMDWWKRKQS